jgi:hypothetical protein
MDAEHHMSVRHSLIPLVPHRLGAALALAWFAAGCADATGPHPAVIQAPLAQTASEWGSFTDEHILQQARTAPPLETYRVSFWARHDKESTVAVNYLPAAGQSVGQPFLRFRIPKFGLKWGPNGTRLEGSDSVFITMTIDSRKLSVDFQPSGVVFSDVFSAGLVMWYVNANPDLNGDGVVDSTDQTLEGQLAISEEPTKLNGWFKVATKNETTQQYVATDVYHFSQYAVSW